MWLRTGTRRGCCEHGNEPSGSVKCRESLWPTEEVFSLPNRAVLHEVSLGEKTRKASAKVRDALAEMRSACLSSYEETTCTEM
jgi:hypothetical protein